MYIRAADHKTKISYHFCETDSRKLSGILLQIEEGAGWNAIPGQSEAGRGRGLLPALSVQMLLDLSPDRLGQLDADGSQAGLILLQRHHVGCG